ncbi:G8 domain-containing protein DDB_G0286897 [Hondaea fermentalgiana]|uniref:G8 domain-containing protein DDB_G0286897 n=1 Tax=Hondaea fermentalgiana TaxID=2315210 RepID=A0A2R5GIX0_9STRA|nr:G8 domain-containing protein DDB_G0286897 [Hondaea fermentalgiana]|eukprot:GBG30555.1 G8 domain-containing protein DDB_G0286897 [Hondaea fermentalgiana]
MGQTNVLARYPWHVHLIGEGGVRSYLKHSSMHHTFYRCATIHGTNNTLLQDNVAYDAIGHCFYSGEDGVEEKNTLAYNLASHVHFMEYPRTSGAQFMDNVYSSDMLTQPADTTASGIYITNAYNSYIGNAASGGYAGFAIVKMPKAIMFYRDLEFDPGMTPEERPFIEFDGNTCHGTGIWWVMGGCIYVGGKLEHVDDSSDDLVYNPGREVSGRSTMCLTDPTNSSPWGRYTECDLVFTNTKIFLANYGLNNWGARSTIDGLEAHDVTRAIAILGYHYVHNMLTVCRSNSFTPELPGTSWYEKRWSQYHMGFEWYDTHQRHIIDGITFRNCGDAASGSPVWRFLTHSDRYAPGFLQATRNVKYENVDTSMLIRPSVSDYLSVSGYLSNWLDADGTVLGSEADGPKIVGAARGGIEWWRTDDDCTTQDIWYLCDHVSKDNDNRRGISSFTIAFDEALDAKFDANTICGNGDQIECPRVGSVVHLGYQDPDAADQVGLPIKGNPVITGPSNGLGWLFLFDSGSPVSIDFKGAQIDEDDVVLIAIPYPSGVTISLHYVAAYWCNPVWNQYCDHEFTSVNSIAEVLASNGDTYFFDTNRGLLYFRFIQQRMSPLDFTSPPAYGNLGTSYFERSDVRIPPIMWHGQLELRVSGCKLNSTNSAYCAKSAYDASAICEDYGFGMGSYAAAFDRCVPGLSVTTGESLYIKPTKQTKIKVQSKITTTEACQQACFEDAECGNFNHFAKRKKCMLLRGQDHEVIRKNGWTAGVLTLSTADPVHQFCQNKKTASQGTVLDQIANVKNWQACQTACRDAETCTHWNYTAKGSNKKTCALLSDLDGGTSADKKSISGPRSCTDL